MATSKAQQAAIAISMKKAGKKPKSLPKAQVGKYIKEKAGELKKGAQDVYKSAKSAVNKTVEAVGDKIYQTVNPYGYYLGQKEKQMKEAKKRAAAKKAAANKPKVTKKPRKTAKQNNTKYKF